ncbi:MAG: hypothetical protein GY702_24335 [Desulfobulbaceae bacterium]|nr:hypothetical protein [Desulfobulbaceae bacterium]
MRPYHLVIPVISTIFLSLTIGLEVHATAVDVYAEGGYTNSHMTVKIFADITPTLQGGSLRSAGVKLTYPSAKLSNPLATKNETDWYLGVASTLYPYKTPDTSTEGEVTFLLGKLDTNHPGTGVDGERILLGSILFDRRVATGIPVANEFALTQGKEPPFVDFATTEGLPLDETVVFQPATITHQNQLNLIATIRILQVITDQDPEVPVRPAEFDRNNDGVVGLEEAIDLMHNIAN